MVGTVRLLLILLLSGGIVHAQEMLKNGDFSEGVKHWQMSQGTATVKDGVLVLEKLPDSKRYPVAYQFVELKADKLYDLLFEYQADNVLAGGEVSIEFPELKSGLKTKISNHNTIWHPQTIQFLAQDKMLRLVLRVASGEAAGARMAFRNIMLRPTGELLPFPRGFVFRRSAGRIQENRLSWRASLRQSAMVIETREIWPENDHRLVVAARKKSSLPVNLTWHLRSLDLKRQPVGKAISGEMVLDNSFNVLEKTFKFISETVFVELSFQIPENLPAEVEFSTVSLTRLPNIPKE